MTYKVFIEESAVEVLRSLGGKKRKFLQDFAPTLSSDPFCQGDFQEVDATGRVTFTQLLEDYAVSYYPDHAEKEVTVFQVTKADR